MKNALDATTSSLSRHLPEHETLSPLVRAVMSFCLRLQLSITNRDELLTNFVPARRLNAVPRLNFAVYSLRDGSDEAVLENSYRSRADGESLLNMYQSSGLAETTFFLVNWVEQRTLRLVRYEAKNVEPNIHFRTRRAKS
jgi:hypothetical protein